MKLSHALTAFKKTSYVVVTFLLMSCGGGGGGSQTNNPTPPQTPPGNSTQAQAFVDEVLSIMRANALTRYDVDWGNIETEVQELAANATTIAQTYPAITRALELIGTNHSLLLSSQGNLISYPSEISCKAPGELPVPQMEDIGYIRVDGFSSTTFSEGVQFATQIQQQIAQQDGDNIRGWIIDLRNNTGGNMWPMITGLGPFFDQNIVGHFIDADDQISNWGYENGSSFNDSNVVMSVVTPYTLINPLAKIAVLSSRANASSGEATLIAFKKQHNVRFFGEETCGLSTANTGFTLSDGSTLLLTTAVTADREQMGYGAAVAVDEPVFDSEIYDVVEQWIKN